MESTAQEVKQSTYFKISNKGELDIRLVALMGGTTKINDASKIGQFGTGLKYAISYLMRSGNKFRMFIGEEEVLFSIKEELIIDNNFKEIYCNSKSMNITTHYGYQWKAWEAVREIWCNAKDEGSESKKVTSENSIISGTKGRTSFFIEMTEEINEVVTNWGKYFIAEKPLFENEKFGIYLNTGNFMKVYKNKTLVQDNEIYKSIFNYDFKDCALNELRQYMGYATSDISRALLASNKEVIDKYLNSQKGDCIEGKLDFEYTTYKASHIKEIFSGHLFLHPDSASSKNKNSFRLEKTLFKIIQDCGLPCEKITQSSGRSYGYHGISHDDNTNYLKVDNKTLEARIQITIDKFKSDMAFTIGNPVDKDFEVLIEEDEWPVFSSDLYNFSDQDLESCVLIAILEEDKANMYKVMKRLIKHAQKSPSFEKILFGV